jgi:hypothetical protein
MPTLGDYLRRLRRYVLRVLSESALLVERGEILIVIAVYAITVLLLVVTGLRLELSQGQWALAILGWVAFVLVIVTPTRIGIRYVEGRRPKVKLSVVPQITLGGSDAHGNTSRWVWVRVHNCTASELVDCQVSIDAFVVVSANAIAAKYPSPPFRLPWASQGQDRRGELYLTNIPSKKGFRNVDVAWLRGEGPQGDTLHIPSHPDRHEPDRPYPHEYVLSPGEYRLRLRVDVQGSNESEPAFIGVGLRFHGGFTVDVAEIPLAWFSMTPTR